MFYLQLQQVTSKKTVEIPISVLSLLLVAAAAATAKIQAMDAVASNAAVLGLSNLTKTSPISTVNSSSMVLSGGVVAASTPVTITTLPIAAVSASAAIPPPGIAIPQFTPDKKIQPAIVTPIVNAPQVLEFLQPFIGSYLFFFKGYNSTTLYCYS